MTSNNHLQLFAKQLASWAEQIIENGRTPFRRVDLFHPLHTAMGTCQPPLIFWINRQSMIAGGLVFLPDVGTNTNFSQEAAAATALGLRHFVTWEEEKINIWKATPEGNRLTMSLPLAKTEDPAAFHHRLYELIDQLKLLSVTGRIPPEEIPPHYVLNLLEETLGLSFPALLEHCRLRLNESSLGLTAEEEAHSWNRLTMLRLLSLLNWKLLPANLPMEHLATTANNLLSHLPSPLGEGLLRLAPEPALDLPEESAVAFHHLLLRLQQIGWHSQEMRGEKILRLLLHLWHGEPPHEKGPHNRNRLLLHSPILAPSCEREISHSGAQLAANTLLRILDNRTHPTQVQGDTFKISAPFAESCLHANFYGTRRPSLPLRRELAGHLRNSWPNRKLSVSGNLPLWATEAAHLLGLTTQESQIELHLPANWLHLLIDTFFSELIFTNFVVESVDCRDRERHLLKLCRRQGETTTECLIADDSKRSIELGQDHNQAASRLLYTLELPSQLFKPFAEQQLVLLTEAENESSFPEALSCYAQSSLGQQLWKLRARIPIPEQSERLVAEGIVLNWLVPEESYLKELNQIGRITDKTTLKTQLAALLNQLLGLPLEVPVIQVQALEKDGAETKQIDRNLNDELLRLLEIEGIPRFPQTYLYRQNTGPLTRYNFTPPLKLRQELLGQYEFEDEKGQQLQVTGEETKEALLLASLLGLTTLEIPIDRQQTAEMLDRYRQDLNKLLESITRLCHLHIDQPTAAQRLQKKLWQQLPLPPLKWLSS